MGKTVLITGASRGIGRETAKRFARENYSVILHYHQHEEAAFSLARELEKTTEILTIRGDVSSQKQVIAMIEKAKERFGCVDILVNNAAIAQQKLFTDITEAEWDTMFDINVKGMFHCTQAVLPDMINQKKGKIINLSSIWGISGASCEVHYSASKAAVIGFTKALAKELGPSGIQVNCVSPGVIATDMNRDLDEKAMQQLIEETPLGVIGQPSDIANTIFFLASEQADFITGQIISPNGGILI